MVFDCCMIYWTSLSVSDVDNAIPQPCPYAIRCIEPCPNGYSINKLGCLTCECNPCRFGQPLYKLPCEKGQGTCKTNNDLCKSLSDLWKT